MQLVIIAFPGNTYLHSLAKYTLSVFQLVVKCMMLSLTKQRHKEQ